MKNFIVNNNQESLADDIRDLIARRFNDHFEAFKRKYNKDIEMLFQVLLSVYSRLIMERNSAS